MAARFPQILPRIKARFDISYISSLPNIEYLAPTNVEEMISMLRWALKQNDTPVVIRQPEHELLHGTPSQDSYATIDYDIAHHAVRLPLWPWVAFGGSARRFAGS